MENDIIEKKKLKTECLNKYLSLKFCNKLVRDLYFEKSDCDIYTNFIEKNCLDFSFTNKCLKKNDHLTNT